MQRKPPSVGLRSDTAAPSRGRVAALIGINTSGHRGPALAERSGIARWPSTVGEVSGQSETRTIYLDDLCKTWHIREMPDTSLSREQLDALAQHIADLSLRIDVAKHSLLTQLRTFDAHEGWASTGFRSTAAWLAWRIDIGAGAAREHVRVARALGELPLTDAAFAAGKLSYAKVRAITRAASPETEQSFLDVAMHATAAQIEKLSAAYRRVRVDASGPGLERRLV